MKGRTCRQPELQGILLPLWLDCGILGRDLFGFVSQEVQNPQGSLSTWTFKYQCPAADEPIIQLQRILSTSVHTKFVGHPQSLDFMLTLTGLVDEYPPLIGTKSRTQERKHYSSVCSDTYWRALASPVNDNCAHLSKDSLFRVLLSRSLDRLLKWKQLLIARKLDPPLHQNARLRAQESTTVPWT